MRKATLRSGHAIRVCTALHWPLHLHLHLLTRTHPRNKSALCHTLLFSYQAKHKVPFSRA